jgi:hypothetical protein
LDSRRKRRKKITVEIKTQSAHPTTARKESMPKRKRKEEEESKEGVKYKGVTKRGEKFQARITIDGKNHNHGTFDTPKEAAEAYDLAAIEAGRPTSKLNFPDQAPKGYKLKREREREEQEARSKEGVKYKGVKKNRERFQATFMIDEKKHYVGTFDTRKEAAEAYDLAAIEAGRPTSKLNFPDQVPKGYVPKRKKLRSDNTIGYRGVTKKGNRFQARIKIDKIQYHIGSFGTTKEAAIAFDVAATFAKRPRSDLNFPEMDYENREIVPKRKRRKHVYECNSSTTSLAGVSKKRKGYKSRILIFNGRSEHPDSFTNTLTNS